MGLGGPYIGLAQAGVGGPGRGWFVECTRGEAAGSVVGPGKLRQEAAQGVGLGRLGGHLCLTGRRGRPGLW
jgi:hypothetical protein